MKGSHKDAILKLIQVNLDAYRGYTSAAKNTNNSLLNTFFNKCALDRKGYAEVLGQTVGIDDIYSSVGTELKADLHRVWMDLKTGSREFHSKAVLEECERGESYAIETYQEVLKRSDLPPALLSTINFQKDDIISKYEQIKKLELEFESDDDKLNRQTPVP